MRKFISIFAIGWLAVWTVQADVTGGIGAQLDKTNGVLLVKSVVATGPAEDAGLRAGSKIVSIDGMSTASMTLDNAVQFLRGVVGTTVKIEAILPDGTQRELSLTRADITVLMQGGPKVQHRLLNNETGLLIVRGFGTNTANEVKAVLDDFQKSGVRNIVLDMRNNDGGSLQAAMDVASMFVGKETPLWQFRKVSSASATTMFGKREKLWNGKLLVLANDKTYFAAELVASACQISERAKIWGQKTTGSVTTYSLMTQPDGTRKRMATGEFLTATGQELQDRGVIPDVSCSLSDEQLFLKITEQFLHSDNLH